MKKNWRYLITGGSGYLGCALIGKMLKLGYRNITVLARNELQLLRLQEQFPKIRIIAGDLADLSICRKACAGMHGIFHLGAFKHVRLAEENVWQCIRSNVNGTARLLDSTLITKPKIFIFISTDKAANVNGVYGATKFLCERLVAEAAHFNSSTRYYTIRYGNVWGSAGSIGKRWPELMATGKEVIITEPRATRFYLTINEAISFIFQCIKRGVDARPMIPDLKGVNLGTVLEACREVYGKSPVRIIGLQPGENMHETLDGKKFSNQVAQYTKAEFKAKFLCHTKQ